MKIAIASSGLGHVARGVETWARDSAEALARIRGKDEGGAARSAIGQPCVGSEAADLRPEVEKAKIGGQRAPVRRSHGAMQGKECRGHPCVALPSFRLRHTAMPRQDAGQAEVREWECKNIQQPTRNVEYPTLCSSQLTTQQLNNSTTGGEAVSDIEVVLFSGDEVQGLRSASNRLQTADHRLQTEDPTTQQLNNQQPAIRTVALRCLRRGSAAARLLARVAPGFTWRWGWTSTYGIEQFTFARSLIKELRKHPVDIVHTQDVIVAQMLEAARKRGRIKAKVILAHGTEESMECLARFEYLQELSPAYAGRWKETDCRPQTADCRLGEGDCLSPVRGSELEHAECTESGECRRDGDTSPRLTDSGHQVAFRSLREEDRGQKSEVRGQTEQLNNPTTEQLPVRVPRVFMIPNFVDTDLFCPVEQIDHRLQTADYRPNKQRTIKVQDEESNVTSGLRFSAESGSAFGGQVSGLRERFGVPPDAFVIGCVAAVKKGHKRIDYLIREFAAAIHGDHRLQTADHRPKNEKRDEDRFIKTTLHLGADESGDGASCFSQLTTQQLRNQQLFLIIAGAKTNESDELVKMAEELAPGRVKFLFDLPREQMPDVYRCMDLYVHPAPEEIFGICLLEAMACWVPVVAHNSEVLKWVVGLAGGACETEDGGLRSEVGGPVARDNRHQTADCRPNSTREQPNNLTTEQLNNLTTGLLEGRGGWCLDVRQEGFLARAISGLKAETGNLKPEGEKGNEVGGRRSDDGGRREVEKIDIRPWTIDHRQNTQIPKYPTTSNPTTQQLSLRDMGARARRHVEEMFSKEVVIPQMIAMYHRVLEDGREGGRGGRDQR